ncbi:MAG: DNA polymerase III subunit delta [Coriobacteriia bacterium]
MAVKGLDDLKPVYLIYGEEELLLERALHRLRGRIGEAADLTFNYEAFDGDNADPGDVIAAANTLPFASERRLVVVTNVQKMNAAAQARLAEYAADPSPSTCLVLVAGKMRKDSKLLKAVTAIGGAAEYKAPKRNEYPRWVIDLFESRGRTLSRDGAETLVRSVGCDLRRLETETEKIIAFVGDRTKISREDVASVVAETAPVSIFEFLDAVGARECGRALELLDDLIRGGEEVIGIHAMTVRHVRTLVSVSALLARSADTGTMMREVGMADWQLRNITPQARRFEPSELSTGLRAAAVVEARMKSGRGEPRLLFERWLVDLCRSEDEHSRA